MSLPHQPPCSSGLPLSQAGAEHWDEMADVTTLISGPAWDAVSSSSSGGTNDITTLSRLGEGGSWGLRAVR